MSAREALAKWWFPIEDYRGKRPSVWLLGGAGVEQAWTANPLIPLIGNYDFAVWRMPGRGVRKDDPEPTSMRAVGRELAESIAAIGAVRPVVAGLSSGGLLAFIATQELEKLGVEVGRFIPIVSTCPNEWRVGAAYAWMTGGPTRYAKRRLAAADKAGKLPPELSGPNRQAMLRPYIVDLTTGFRAWSHTTITTPITDISASDDARLRITHAKRWRRYTRGDFDSIITTGGHLFYRDHPEIVSRVLDRESDIAYSGGF
ncbi:alpha/beta fold hydrolase [Nocardia sp. NPDC058658]|uniref:alpha/beta fold hydrolase n=1 Tax=Nocardia sp. NPDC058658 TaxID=3346580 RepID=UPI00364C8259